MTDEDRLLEAYRFLSQSADYRIQRRMLPVGKFHDVRPGAPSFIGAVVDCETTGLDHERHKIIELAVQRIRYDELGRITEVGEPRSWLEDPCEPLEPEIVKVTGLTNEQLAGHRLDEQAAIQMIGSADLVIAHNARFDRPFVDKRLPQIAGKAWACTLNEPDWVDLGFDGKNLASLVSQCGLFFEGHRGANDVLALIHLLGHEYQPGYTILSHLLETSARPSYNVACVDSPYDSKDRLKARGYRWDPTLKIWSREISAAKRDDEEAWLKSDVYVHGGGASFHPMTAIERYRSNAIATPIRVGDAAPT